MTAEQVATTIELWKPENFHGNEEIFIKAVEINIKKAKLKGRKQEELEWKEIYQSFRKLTAPEETELHIDEDEEDYNLGF